MTKATTGTDGANPSNTITHHDDDDSLDDHEGHISSNFGAPSYLAESWRAVGQAAMRVPVAAEQAAHSSMAARLGSGTTGSIRRSGGRVSIARDVLNEETGLLDNDNAPSSSSRQENKSPPPLLKWLWVALLCALAYALYNIFIKKGSSDIHPVLGGVILQFVAAFLGSVLLAGIVLFPDEDVKIHIERPGILWSMGAGLWVGVAEITSFIVTGMGVSAAQFIPINIGGSVAIGSVLGVILLGETVMLQGWTGVILLVGGIGKCRPKEWTGSLERSVRIISHLPIATCSLGSHRSGGKGGRRWRHDPSSHG